MIDHQTYYDLFNDDVYDSEDVQLSNEHLNDVFPVVAVADEEYGMSTAKIAKHLVNFFNDKETVAGNKIEKTWLVSKANLEMVKSYNKTNGIILAVSRIYESIAQDDGFKHLVVKNKKMEVTMDVPFVRDILDYFCEVRVPKSIAGGVLILYFQYCKGLKIV